MIFPSNVAKKKQKRYRALIIEDDEELGNVLDQVLRSIHANIQIDWAPSAEEGVDFLRRKARSSDRVPYDLIIADIFLEGESTGLDFWRTCCESFPEIPLVVTSAISSEKFFNSIGKDAIAPPYLAKPFSIKACKQMFEGMLES